jgi:hypothetical protein
MDGRQDCFVSQGPRTLAGQRWQAAQAASQIAASKTSAKSQDLGVVETAQVSSAVEGLNGQRPHCPGIGSPVEVLAQVSREAEMDGMRQKSGRSKTSRRETTRSFERSESVGKRPAVTLKGDPAWPW